MIRYKVSVEIAGKWTDIGWLVAASNEEAGQKLPALVPMQYKGLPSRVTYDSPAAEDPESKRTRDD